MTLSTVVVQQQQPNPSLPAPAVTTTVNRVMDDIL